MPAFVEGRSFDVLASNALAVALSPRLRAGLNRLRSLLLLWARHDIRELAGGTTTVHHPVVGDLRLHRDKLPVDDVILVVYYPDEGSDSAEKLALLASLAAPVG